MTLIGDILLAAGAIGAAFYCFILGRRLRKFNDLETGMGGAVAVLSAQVDDLQKTASSAQKTAVQSTAELDEVAKRAQEVQRQLELQIASLHDFHPNKQTMHNNVKKKTKEQEFAEPIFVRHRPGVRPS